MPTIIRIPHIQGDPLPSHFQYDLRYAPEFVVYCLQKFSAPGSVILDPFAGFGTTLLVAQNMGRIPFGIELDLKKVLYVREKLKDPLHLIHGDSTQLASYSFPNFDLLLTSPPYMNSYETLSPFDEFKTQLSYPHYLDIIESIFSQATGFLKPTGKILIEVSNLYHDFQVTTLAWDIARRLRNFLRLEREVIIAWEGDEKKNDRGIYGYGYDHSYLLVFSSLI